MLNEAEVILTGNVVSEPDIWRGPSGRTKAQVRVAHTPRWRNSASGEWEDGETSYVNVVCWRTLANNVALSLRKGEPVLVRGKLRVRRWESKDGTSVTAFEVEASSIGHDLNRGSTTFFRTRRSPGETAVEGAQAQAAANGQAPDGGVPPDGQQAEVPDGPDDPLTGTGAAGTGAAGDGVLDDRAVAEFGVAAGDVDEEDEDADRIDAPVAPF